MIRSSRQRDAVRAAFERASRPLTPQEILAFAQQSVPTLGIATVYRAIKDLLVDGELVCVDVPGATPRYELAGKDHHHHFLCRACARTFDVDGCPGKLPFKAPRGFITERHEILLHGLCADCRE